MKVLLILLNSMLVLSGLSQDSITLTVRGKAVESSLNEAIFNTRFSVAINSDTSTSYRWITTDNNGAFDFTVKVAADKKFVAFDFNGEKSGYANHYIHSVGLKGKDSVLVFPMNFIREKVCKDVWLPKPVFFSHSNCDSTIDNFNDLKSMLSFYKDNPNVLKKSTLVITAYNSFSEKSKIASCRLELIKKIIAESGVSENQIKYVVGGKKEFTYFYYHSGCHTEQEFKENIVLSKGAYKKASAEQKKEVEKLRRSVIFTWE